MTLSVEIRSFVCSKNSIMSEIIQHNWKTSQSVKIENGHLTDKYKIKKVESRKFKVQGTGDLISNYRKFEL